MSDSNQKQQPVLTQDQPRQEKPTAKQYLTAVNVLGQKMGFTMIATAELFKQDNGTLSIKPFLQIVPIEKETEE